MNKLKRDYDFLKPYANIGMAWQLEALERIHVFNKGGASTVLFFNKNGTRLSSHMGSEFAIPIQYFDPKQESLLSGYLQEMEKNGKLNPGIENKQRVTSARKYLAGHRPKKYQYRPTREEEQQIARVFVEINKYPEISSIVSKNEENMWLISSPGKGVALLSTLYTNDQAGGYFYPPGVIAIGNDAGTVRIGNQDVSLLRFRVAEETLHAFDAYEGVSSARLDVKPEDIEAFRAYCDEFKSLILRYQFKSSGLERANTNNIVITPKEQAGLNTFKEATRGLMETHKRTGHPSSLDRRVAFSDLQTRVRKELEAAALDFERLACFKNESLYQDQSFKSDQTEFFAQLAKLILLRRHIGRHSSAELEKDTESFLFDTPYAKRLIGYLDEVRDLYKRHGTEELARGEKMAEQIATALEREQPGITYYNFSDHRQVHNAMTR